MPRETLLTLANDVTRLLAAGAQQAVGDDGLQRRSKSLRQLSAQVPALGPIADAVDRVLNASPKQATAALLDLSLIARQAKASLASAGMPGDLRPLAALGEWDTPAAVKDAQSLRDFLDSRTTGQRLENLKDALNRGDLADLRLVQPLVRSLNDGNHLVAEFIATEALPKLGRGVLPMVEAGFSITGKALDARRLLAICHLDRDRGREWCHQALEHGSPAVRIQALECLPLVDPRSAERVAMKFLQDPKSEVRAAACIALTNVPKDEVLDAMIGLIDDTKEVWASVMRSLETFSHQQATQRLVSELQQAAAAFDAVKDEPKPAAKGKSAAKTPKKQVKTPAQRERERLQQRMIRYSMAVSRRPDAQLAAAAMVELSQYKIADVRDEALRTLRVIGTKSPLSVPAMIAALNDKTQAVVLTAIDALGASAPNSQDAVASLLDLAGDAKAKQATRTRAFQALGNGKINDPAVVPFLIEQLSDKQVWIRESAAEALEAIGPPAVAAIPFLIEALRDPRIRYEVNRALTAIDPKGEKCIQPLLGVVRNTDEKKEYREAAFDVITDFNEFDVPLELLRQVLGEKNCPFLFELLREIQKQGERASPLLPDMIEAIRRGVSFSYYSDVFKSVDPSGATVVPAMTGLLSSKSKETKLAALMALNVYGTRAASAADAVRALEKDKDKTVQQAAKETITTIC